jgi:uncharacterized protein YbjT (DUF2867 family)
MQPMIFVSGATGNVGFQVAKALLAQGTGLRVGDIDPQLAKERIGGGVEAVEFRFGATSTYTAAFAGTDQMFLMRPPQISNVKKVMFPAMDAAKKAGVKHFVFLSIIGVEHNTHVPHYKIEQRLREMDVDYTFLRCSFFMQNLNTTHRAEISERNELFIPAGRARTSFLDVRDIGAVAALVLTQPGHAKQAYDLTGPEALDYYQTANLFTEVLGRKITYRNPSPLRYILRRLSMGAPLAFALITAWLYSSTRKGMAEPVTGEVERLLGRKPTALKQYILDYKGSWS